MCFTTSLLVLVFERAFGFYYQVVVSSRSLSLVAISCSGALPRRMLISAAWSARWLQF
jgi:hypothetical protein